jgi:hypothetical protein
MGFGILAAFLALGVLAAEGLFSDRPRMTRAYLGLTFGLMMMMWLPSVWAFKFNFTVTAQWWALGTAFLLSFALFLLGRSWRGERPRRADMPAKLLLLIVPLLLFSFYLQYTHTLRPVDGALHVGQSTYGDLCLHLGIATGLRDAAYPPQYTLLPGTMLGYPFLSDAMVTSMLLFGAPLQWSFIVTGTLMMGLVYWGFLLLSWELTRSRRAVIIAFLLMFLNGGLGFLYTFDGAFKDGFSKLKDALFGFYLTPTNMPDLNLRWVNVIADLMIPQRTLLAGWTVCIPALTLLAQAIRRREEIVRYEPLGPVRVVTEAEGSLKDFAVLGVWAGMIPMIHTHSFLALGLISLGAFGYLLIKSEDRLRVARNFLVFGAIALIMALPQLMTWTFPQTEGGGSLKLHLDWVNNGNNGMIDGWLWFWVKNVGLVFLLLVPSALSQEKRGRALSVGALAVFLVAEAVLFQPNPYDNNKLFYVAFILMLPLVADYVVRIYDRLKGVRWRVLLLGAFMVASTLSGAITLAREAISDYELFGADEVQAADYIEKTAPRDAVFLTGGQHNNPVAALAGRELVCGTGTYLYFHGVSYQRQQQAGQDMYEDPADSAPLFDVYHVDYIYISSYERGNYDIDESFFRQNFPVCYQNGEVTVYAVSARARAAAGL